MHCACGGHAIGAVIIARGATPEIVLTGLLLIELDIVSNFFGNTRQIYDQIGIDFSRTRAKMWPSLLPLLEDIQSTDSILDLGCGNGRLLTALNHPQNYLGIDFSETLLLEAEKLHPHHLFRRGDLTDPKTFEILEKYQHVFCLAVLHHLELDQQKELFERIKLLLTPDGRSVISLWDLTKTKYPHHKDDPHVLIPFNNTVLRPCYIHDEDSLRRLVLSVGFKIDFFEQKDGNFLIQLS